MVKDGWSAGPSSFFSTSLRFVTRLSYNDTSLRFTKHGGRNTKECIEDAYDVTDDAHEVTDDD